MANSGCPVPEDMMGLKTSRDKKRELSARAPKRDGISRESKWEKQEAVKKKEMIASSKRRKVKKEEGGQEVKSKKPRIEGEGSPKEITTKNSSRNTKKKSKRHIGKENEATSMKMKSVKKKKKKQKLSSEGLKSTD